VEVATVGQVDDKVELISPIRKSEALNPENRPARFLAPKEICLAAKVLSRGCWGDKGNIEEAYELE
jgi:hypothetical protein